MLTDEQQAAIAMAWEHRPASVYDGQFFHVTGIQPRAGAHEISGVFTSYQVYFAQKQLGTDFGVRPLGVSGLTLCQDHIILAQRASVVTAYANALECVPSGSLSAEYARPGGEVDYMAQLRAEFHEEVGLPPARVVQTTPFAVVYDMQDRVYDVVCTLAVDATLDEVLGAMQNSAEYTRPRAVPLADLGAWFGAHRAQLIPTSQAILSLWMRRPGP